MTRLLGWGIGITGALFAFAAYICSDESATDIGCRRCGRVS